MKIKKEQIKEIAWNSLIGVLILSVILFVAYFINKDVTEVIKKADESTVTTVSLRSIDYSNEVKGVFALGSGGVHGVDYYVCYEVLEDKGIKLTKFDANKTVIYETLAENEMAYATVKKDGYGNVIDIKMYVPQNTIQVEYNFND